MVFDFSVYFLLALTGLLAGFLDAVAGGGGLITIPALLSAGLPPHMALGTNKVAASLSSLTSAITFYRQRLFQPGFWWRALLAAAVGALVGTLLVNLINAAWLEKLLPLLIFGVAIYTIVNRRHEHQGNQLPRPNQRLYRRQWGQGLLLGAYDGAFGPGAGAFLIVSSMALYRLNLLLSSGLAKGMVLTSNLVSLLTFIALGQVDWILGLTLSVGIMAGSFIGAHSAIRFGAGFIRPIFVVMVLALSLKLAWQAWF
ncbi:sulfite exporter TauE/SafE family protein [Zobellella maritima]|uniref:sulfite exporter TauE/SafE family protein n=1 Tax=Zobellella maritima TaxID=2059725 RepID=UPI000E308CEC|nr:TSUP family transporter [Zobellella maritima]